MVELTTTPARARLDAAADLAGSTSSSPASAPPAGETRATAIQNDGARPPGAAVSTRQPTHRASVDLERIFGTIDLQSDGKARRR